MSRTDLRFRQIHLDFHTSQHIVGIGSQFDPDEYADTLKRAHVNSINTFARCHHGYIYFDTKKFPERRHPHLTRNLLKEQIDACHKRDIRAPIYITIQWDLFSANEHPDWVVITDQGCLQGTKPYEPGFYRTLCVNSPYYEKLLKPFVGEVLETLEVDGFWFDIVSPQACSCFHCRKRMEAKGLDPSLPENRMKNGVEVLNEFKHDLTSFVHKQNKDALVFYNAGHVGPNTRSSVGSYTHLELESLPSGGWGYMHFPAAMRYARTLGLDCIGMTGKFHTSWGDFHSFKNPAALQFECFQMLALNAKACVGDQLHPTGKICQTTYGLIGSVYAEVEKKEAWCTAAKPLVDIAVVSPEEFLGGGHWGLPEATLGSNRLLQEGRHQFDFIDTAADLSPYKLVILPDEIPVSEQFAGKIEKYIADGGSLIATCRSGLTPKKDAAALKSLGIKLVGEAPFSPDFILPGPKINAGLADTGHVMYMKGMQVEALPGSEVLADVAVPYFNRTWQHFCSHAHTPSSGKIGYPGIVRNGNAIYFMHPIFSQYAKNAPLWCKRLMLNAIELLLPDPLVRLHGPSSVIATLNEQPAENRLVLHLLHYIPERRGKDFDVIEDVIPVYDIKLSVKVPRKVSEVSLVPEQSTLKFKQKGDRIEFTVKEISGHQMVEIK